MELSETFYRVIETTCRDLYIRALKDIPDDVRVALKKGHGAEVAAGNQTASKVMLTVLENIKLADDKDMMVCQDTGLAVYKLKIGNELAQRGLDMVQIRDRIRIGAERVTREHPLRSNSVHPFTRKN